MISRMEPVDSISNFYFYLCPIAEKQKEKKYLYQDCFCYKLNKMVDYGYSKQCFLPSIQMKMIREKKKKKYI